ncbi:MAG: hypothetical protein ACXVRN_10995 [Solirubrobacteraceae bacterium]
MPCLRRGGRDACVETGLRHRDGDRARGIVGGGERELRADRDQPRGRIGVLADVHGQRPAGRAVPATGQGYAGGSVPAQSELGGFYAKPTKPKSASDAVQQRANIPTWSTLTFADGGQPFSLTSGTTTGWRQSLDLHTGTISTSATWRAPDGHTTRLAYQVLTDPPTRTSPWSS